MNAESVNLPVLSNGQPLGTVSARILLPGRVSATRCTTGTSPNPLASERTRHSLQCFQTENIDRGQANVSILPRPHEVENEAHRSNHHARNVTYI
jgi:hypothetical protein